MSADPRAASILLGRLVPVDAAMLVQMRGGPPEFPRDSLLPQEVDSGLNLCKRISTRAYEKRSMLISSSSGADQIDYNQLRSILIAFLIAFACMARTIADNLIHRVEESSMPKHIKVWDALWPLKYYCSTRFI